MKVFNVDKFLKHLIIRNGDMGLERKLDLIKELNYPNLTGIQMLKAIEGIVNYGTIVDMDILLELPNEECMRLNTSLEILLDHFMSLTEEELREAIDLLLEIDVDKRREGLDNSCKDITDRGVIDILQDYVMASRRNGKKLGKDEVSLLDIKIDYKAKEMIRDFSEENGIFS